MKHEYSAGIIVFFESNRGREYLLLHYQAGHWDFPKGHIEHKETKQQAALRELQEETGLSVQLIDGFCESFSYIYRVPKTKELSQKEVYFFVGESATKHITLSHEHVDYAWLPLDQALEKLTYDNAKDILYKADLFLQDRMMNS